MSTSRRARRHFPTLLAALAAALLCLHGVSALAAAPQVETEAAARWHINYASYLTDVGKYLEAIEQYDTANEMSAVPATRATSLMGKAMVLSTYLDAPDKAEGIYRALLDGPAEFAEGALYRLGFLLMETGDDAGAGEAFRRYLRDYPTGRFRFQAQALLGQVQAAQKPHPAAPPAPAPVPTPAPTPAPALPEAPLVRVRLLGKNTALTVRGLSGQVCADGLGCGAASTLGIKDGALSLNGAPLAARTVRLSSSSPLIVQNNKESKTVRGTLEVSVRDASLLAVNILDIEDYLRAVVPAESYPSWPMETLKAQAVAARTYAYYQKQHRKHLPYDLVDSTGDQMYGGTRSEHKRTDTATRETRGRILQHGGKPILAQYTANSGGHTADAGAIFGVSKPYLAAHPDPASLKGKMSSWRRSFSAAEIEAALGKAGTPVPGLTAIEPLERGPSGRITRVRIHYSGGTRDLKTRTQFAGSRALRLPEILLDITRRGGNYDMQGHGHGHGVGYSQWGAAELGKTMPCDDILKYYYAGATVETRW